MKRNRLWSRPFVIFFVGTLQSALGSAFANVGLTFLLLKQTGRADHVAINLGLSVISGFLSPFAGVIVDRFPFKILLILVDVLRGLIAIGLWWMVKSGHFHLELVYASTFLMSLLATFHIPASLKAVPYLVSEDSLTEANAAINGATSGMNLLGMVIGGILVQFIGIALILMFDAITFLLMAVLITTVSLPFVTLKNSTFWEDFRNGLSLLLGNPILRFIPILALVVNAAFAPIQVLIPFEMFKSGAGSSGYGIFMAVFFAAIILGNIILAKFGSKNNGMIFFIMIGLGLISGGLTAMAFLNGVWLYVLAAFCGLGNALINTSIMTILQSQIPNHAHGKVFGVLSGAAQIALPPAFLLVSLTLQSIPAASVFLASGIVIALCALVWFIVAIQLHPKKLRGSA